MELNGKIINFLGDSITEGTGVSDLENRYDNRLKRMCNLKEVHNYGIGGTRLAHQSIPSEKPRYDLCFCGRAYNLDPNADIVVVYGGVNDYIHGDAPIGNVGDQTPATFRGAVCFLMNLLKTNFPNKPIIFMTPAHCHFKGVSDAEVSPRPMKKTDAMPLLGYVEIIKEIGAQFDIPVLDMFENLGVDPNRPEDSEKLTVDGLHFNDAGHEYIANALAKFLKAL